MLASNVPVSTVSVKRKFRTVKVVARDRRMGGVEHLVMGPGEMDRVSGARE